MEAGHALVLDNFVRSGGPRCQALSAHIQKRLTSLMEASKECTCVTGAVMIVCRLNVLTTGCTCKPWLRSVAQSLAAISTHMPPAFLERAKKKPPVTSFASATNFLDQAAAKRPQRGPVFCRFTPETFRSTCTSQTPLETDERLCLADRRNDRSHVRYGGQGLWAFTHLQLLSYRRWTWMTWASKCEPRPSLWATRMDFWPLSKVLRTQA